MLQVVPLIVYFGVQKFATPEVLGDILPKELQGIIGWLPAVAAVIAYIVTAQVQQAQAGKATSALVGQEAPDVEFEFQKEGAKTLRALMKESPLPTLIDFYQNF
mmetsp:Transcript_108234/g.334267  ORF Transcript_108234/g.334267 Transcript_108234/m.334267 type:complete len:104 (-) Transcript_108234:350-661(-)